MLRRHGGAPDRQHSTTGRTPPWYANYHAQTHLRLAAPLRFADWRALTDKRLPRVCIVSNPTLLGDLRSNERAQIVRLLVEPGRILGRQRGLTDRERDAIVRALGEDGAEYVLVLADWVVSKKSLHPLPGTGRLFGGEILAESPAAIQFVAGTVEWVPKSQAVVYTLGEGQTLTGPQRGLAEFCTDGGNR